ncbi:alkaline phosphatase D family protein [Opitutales bacterium]|nr:alkaline phosphatase D family protein [Opitutales bacterium]
MSQGYWLFLLLAPCFLQVSFLWGKVYQTNGIKIGEVTQDSAIIWTRLTKNPTANTNGEKFRKVPKHAPQIPKGKSLSDMEGAVPGIAGSVRISWQNQGVEATRTEWLPVDEDRDFTRKVKIGDLLPGQSYEVRVESRSANGKAGQTIRGKFRTAPAPEMIAPIKFVVTSCQDYPRRDTPQGHQIYPNMLNLDPAFFIHTGDIEYYDKAMPWATNRELARFKWNRLYGLPHLANFHTKVASYFMKDDHDTTSNDSWPGVNFMDLSWEQGKNLFREQFPVRKDNYRTIRWGKDLQIWMVEGRDYRSPNNQPDGPEKTIWGKKQKEWFFRTFEESDAAFRVLISPTPVVGPDRSSKNDNHANKGFTHEGNEIRDFLASHKNTFVICGDRHWQYVSVDQQTGLKEFSCGSASDEHASGWKDGNRLPEHTFLKVQGGFLSIEVKRAEGKPTLVATHHEVTGKTSNIDRNRAN